ncbi:SLAM family member 5-like isoform X2 [Xenopus laevis]|uniref:SLAM family member 5-like isoform X2 n=1 Tax=Xenopus laevis TaxID=8355 RepID=A0A8J1LIW5_XENLA|nr:SLAM family member 5-like isoform X2 [Xenopus laevis]
MQAVYAELLLSLSLSLALLPSESYPSLVQVNGLLNQSIHMSNYLKQMDPVEDVVWHHEFRGKIFKIASFDRSKLTVKKEELIDRLESSEDGTSLTIRELRMEDSGTYHATITFKNQESIKISFHLTVYEPVPVPSILKTIKGTSPEWCNLTLHCFLPINASLHVEWKEKYKDLGFKPSKNGSSIELALQPEMWGTEFLCLVKNPVSYSNASLLIQQECRILAVVILLLPLAAGIIISRRKTRRKEPAPSTREVKCKEPAFAVVQKCPQDVSDLNLIETKPRSEQPPKAKVHTIYDELRPSG